MQKSSGESMTGRTNLNVCRLDRVPPQNLDAERMILGAMMMADESSQTVPQAIELLDRDDFYKEAHGKIFDAIEDLFESASAVDLVTVSHRLEQRSDLEKVGGVPTLNDMIEVVPSAANLEYYAAIVKELATKRRMIYMAAEMYNEAFDDTIPVQELVSKAQSKILHVDSQGSDKLETVKSLLKETFSHIQDLYNREEHIVGIPTGFVDLDAMTAGFQKGEYIVVGGRPSMGKSAFLQNIAEHISVEMKIPVLFFSSEMSKTSLVIRMLGSISRISAHALRSGELHESDWPKITIGAGLLSEAPIIIDDTPGITITDLRARAYRAVSQFKVGAIFVDYIQELRDSSLSSRASKREVMDEVSGGLKRLARELEIPVIVASQLSRQTENRPDKRPQLSDLRESGNIEQDADVVLFIYRDAYYDEDSRDRVAEIFLRKQRNGPTGKVRLVFDKRLLRFENMAKGIYRDEPFL